MSFDDSNNQQRKNPRESAELAKKKLKLDLNGDCKSAMSNHVSKNSIDSTKFCDSFCEKSACKLDDKLVCPLEISTICQKSANSRTSSMNDLASSSNESLGHSFYHISENEHFCHSCYEDISRPGRPWNEIFVKWKSDWAEKTRCSPTLRMFVSDRLLPFWTRCKLCSKWRKMPPNLQLEVDFSCQCCQSPQDLSVDKACRREWAQTLALPLLLHNSPALHYLRDDYYLDEIGMSPVHAFFRPDTPPEFLQPFHIPHEGSSAHCLRPDVMEHDEILHFPEYYAEPVLYLAIRNLVVALWNLNPFDYLTLEYCIPYVQCRGLGRIWYTCELNRVLRFLTLKGVINYGILDTIEAPILSKSLDVVVIGAGMAGLCAARQLRSFGAKVKVLEARQKLGGRIHDDWSLGVAVGCGAQLVTGVVNNPIILMCHQEEERILQWQLGNVEFSCGANLNDVSAKYWDQNEAVPQFAGDHALLTEGSTEIVRKLAEGLDIRPNHQVAKIEWNGRKKILVRCENGKRFCSDKVLVAIPLAVLQNHSIGFCPELPDSKLQSINRLGAGLIEKVAVRFPRNFWSKLTTVSGTVDYFGNVPKSKDTKGLFNMFYDFSTRNSSAKKHNHVLMSYMCGESANLVNEKSDVEIVELFIDTLRDLFPDEDIPDSTGHVVSHWGRDPHIGMSYSFVKVGSTGEDYDRLARSVDDRLFFAGECTNRYFPQTMTGAFLSGLREAGKIAFSWQNMTKM